MKYQFWKFMCLVVCSGCAVIDPGQVGSGSYMQQLNVSGAVILEEDSAKHGYLNCQNAANTLIQARPQLKGKLICSKQPSTQALPFQLKLHSHNSPTANEMRETSPFIVRYATRSLCETELKRIQSDKKWKILESKC